MKKYHIAIPEVHIAYYEVDAKSANDAVQIAKSCDGDSKLLDVGYSHDLNEEIEIIQANGEMLTYTINEEGEVIE